MASPSNGGIIGKSNNTSFGKCVTTTKTATGAVTTGAGTGVIKALIIAGAGGGGYDGGGGGGAFSSNSLANRGGISSTSPGCGSAKTPA